MEEMNLEITQELKNMIADIYWRRRGGAGREKGWENKGTATVCTPPPFTAVRGGKIPTEKELDNRDSFTFDYCIIPP